MMQKCNLKNENGRSMIEMLGVLAIIGVLSVGGIAGYSKAMHKYRINKTIEQITLIAGNIRAFFAPQRSYEGLGYCTGNNDYCKLIKKAKLVPDEMLGGTYTVNNLFGYAVQLYTAHKSTNTDKQAFSIQYMMGSDYEVCIDLVSYDWTAAGVKGIEFTGFNPTYATVPVSIDTAVDKCSSWKNNTNTITGSIQFYFDINSNCWNETKGNKCS